ncbi:MAG: DUF1320 family protein [Magnetococcales bacterium]|nr:DUF1320 family protein [Magnetococcales bacterium]
MSYASHLNLLQWYGAKELAQTATPDDLAMLSAQLMRLTIEGGDRDSYSTQEIEIADKSIARITAALAEASLVIDSYISRRYELPIADTDIDNTPLPRCCGAMARRLLYDDAVPQEVERRYEETLTWLKDLANNRADLNLGTSSQTRRGAALADFENKQRIFDNTSLKGFVTTQDYRS